MCRSNLIGYEIMQVRGAHSRATADHACNLSILFSDLLKNIGTKLGFTKPHAK
jgi:hypothetical protein